MTAGGKRGGLSRLDQTACGHRPLAALSATATDRPTNNPWVGVPLTADRGGATISSVVTSSGREMGSESSLMSLEGRGFVQEAARPETTDMSGE